MNSVVIRDREFALQQCIEATWRPLDVPTDWDAVTAAAADINTAALTAELQAGAPYDRNELNALRVFRLQTRIRIGLRCQRGLPQHARFTCAFCGTRPAHAVPLRYYSQCLYCAESGYLYPGETSSHDWNRVAFDVASGTWGIAYVSKRDRATSAAIVANQFPNYESALTACLAPDRFIQLFNRICGAGFEVDGSSVVPTGDLFAQQLPLNPEQWRRFCDECFRKVETTESEPYGYEVRDVCSEFFRDRH